MSKAVVSWLWLLAASPTTPPAPTKVEQALEFMNSNPYIGWGIAGFVLLAMATAAIAQLTGNLTKISEDIQKIGPFKKANITDEQRNALLQDLNKVALQEVTERLEKSLHHRIQIDLHRELQMQRVGRFDTPQQPQQSPKTTERLGSRWFKLFSGAAADSAQPMADSLSTRELFERPDMHGRLLILGEPGAGKTTELLALAKDLLQQAQQASDHPIPIIFELSAWSDARDKKLEDWFMAQLKDKYDVPLEVSQPWIDNNQILPLLDGLDELRRVDDADSVTSDDLDRQQQAQQIKCIRDINAYLEMHPQASLVVCCRRKEYEALEQQGEKLKSLKGAIYLQALSDDQIAEYFEQSDRPHLWTALRDQSELVELARSPLFLLMLVVVYQGQTIQSPIHSKEQLLDAYIDKQLADLNNQGAYPPGRCPTAAQTHHYLSWLAVRLREHKKNEFLIEHLQPSWLYREDELSFHRVVASLIFGLIFGLIGWLIDGLIGGLIGSLIGSLIGGLIGSLIGGLIGGLTVGLMGGLFFGLFFGLISGLHGGLHGGLLGRMSDGTDDIRLVEKLTFSWQKASEDIIAGLIAGLILGLVFGLIFGLSGEKIFGTIGGLSSGLIFGIYIGLIFGLILGTIFALIDGLSSSELQIREKKTPNQAFWRSLSSALTIGLLFGLSGGLLFGLSGGLLFGLSGGLLFGLSGGLIFGLSGGLKYGLLAVVEHIVLRAFLLCSGSSPRNYKLFMEHAENHRFIQRVGGRYRFVHDLLRSRFAERYQPRHRQTQP